MSNAPNPWWTVLGVSPAASDAAVRRAWRALARDAHPDANGGDRRRWDQLERAYREARSARRWLRRLLPRLFWGSASASMASDFSDGEGGYLCVEWGHTMVELKIVRRVEGQR